MFTYLKNIINKINKKVIIVFLVFILLFSLELFIARRTALENRFSDEIAHIVTGHLLFDGKAIYKETQNNHQPLVYVFAGLAEKVSHPDNFFELVRREREAMILYSFLWQGLILLFFGTPMILFIILFELLKFANIGHNLLGESLAVYPFIFLIGIWVKFFIYKKKLTTWEMFIFSLSSFIVIFTLLPLWPSVILLLASLSFKLRSNKKNLLILFTPLITLTIILFFNFSFPDYFRETLLYQQYFLKYENNLSAATSPLTSITIFILPLLVLQFLSYSTAIVVAGFNIIYLAGVIKYKNMIINKTMFLLFLIILLSNLRVDSLKDGNFHLIPWIGAFMFIPFLFLSNLHSSTKNTLSRLIISITLILITFIGYKESHLLFDMRNLMTDYEIGYSDSEKYARVINIVKNNDDSLIVIPNDPVIHWITNIPFGTRVIEYYSWIYNIERYSNEIYETFKKDPPEFVVDTGLNQKFKIELFVLNQLETQYVNVYHLGKPSKLFIKHDKLNKITEEQKNKLNELSFTFQM